LETASTNLDPEKFINYEIGVKARSGGFTGTLSYFYTDISDLIVRRPTGRIIDGDAEVTKANAGDGFVHGVEFGGAYEFNENWSVFGNITWLEGEADAYPNSDKKSQREPLSKIQPITGTGGIRWTNDSKTVWTELVVTAADKADKLSTADLSDTQRIPRAALLATPCSACAAVGRLPKTSPCSPAWRICWTKPTACTVLAATSPDSAPALRSRSASNPLGESEPNPSGLKQVRRVFCSVFTL